MGQKTSFIILFFIIIISNYTNAQKEIFLKEYQFKLKTISSDAFENEFFITTNLNKNSIYKFQVINHISDAKGVAIVKIQDSSTEKLLVTNELSNHYFKIFQLQCNKTGYYDLIISFKNNQLGNSVVKMFLVQK